MYENLVLYAFHIKGCVIQRQKLRFQYQYHQILFVNKVISHRKETPIGSDGKNLHLFLPLQCWCLKEGSKADVQFQNYVRRALAMIVHWSLIWHVGKEKRVPKTIDRKVLIEKNGGGGACFTTYLTCKVHSFAKNTNPIVCVLLGTLFYLGLSLM